MLERTRAECDDCYCQNCYIDMHANGKRALHRWVGFMEYAQVRGVKHYKSMRKRNKKREREKVKGIVVYVGD